MSNLIVFMVFLAILILAISVALTTFIAQNKGQTFKKGLLLGIFLPFIGAIMVAMMPTTDKKIADEMYKRDMINLSEFEKTQEILLKKNKK